MALTKLQIIAYSDYNLSRQVGSYTLQVNPESFTHGHTTEFEATEGTDTAGEETKYKTIRPEIINFEFYLDSTGAIPGVTDISKEISTLKKLIYDYNGDIHGPNFLKILWGTLSFKCRLTSLSIDYMLFKQNGVPLRAKIVTSFSQYISASDRAKASGRNSPDMTHARTVNAGDTLPLMCYRIYGDSSYYIKIAQHNQLEDFRSLKPGTVITFPPLGA